jgi:uncharacterized radical SAM superfamily Fe-S cluster-containing enzyme
MDKRENFWQQTITSTNKENSERQNKRNEAKVLQILTNLATERMLPFKLPNVEKATNMGMHHDMTPYNLSPNV